MRWHDRSASAARRVATAMPELSLPPSALAGAAHAPRRGRLAGVCVLLMLLVVVSSGWLRLAQERPDCPVWPACRAAPADLTPRSVAPAWMVRAEVLRAVRLTHRVAASAVLPAAAALALLALWRRPRAPATGRRALGMLGLALALAALGIVTPGSRSVWVLLGNQLGGLLLLMLACATWRAQAGAASAAGGVRGARAVALLWLLQAGLGALSGAGWGAGVALAHLAIAGPAVLAAFVLGLAGWQRGRRGDGLALALVATAQLLLGLAAMLTAAPPALVLLHHGLAAAGLGLLAGWGRGLPR